MDDPASIAEGQKRRARDFRRTYKACKLCRRKKTRCVLEGTATTCMRCRRERRQCEFPESRSYRDEEGEGEKNEGMQQPTTAKGGMERRASLASATATATASSSAPGYSLLPGREISNTAQDNALDASYSVEGVYEDAFPPRDSEATPAIAGGDLTSDMMMRTLVVNGNDALGLLFEAARQTDTSSLGQSPATTRASARARHEPLAFTANMNPPLLALLRIWEALRFVKMGWFTSEEAVLYVEFFRQNLAPRSMVSRDMDLSPEAHFTLITQEPLLTCVVLLIAAKHCILPGTGGVARSTLVHHRIWEHCHHLIMRIIFGQEKRSKAKTRTWGAVRALLLMVEWHPRAIHFPPGADGWDSSLLLTDVDPRDDRFGNRADTADEINERWRREVISPARTFDRMAWMLLGCAQSLALELGVCDTSGGDGEAGREETPPERQARKSRLREMIYILVEQHSRRLGCPASMVPGGFSRAVFDGPRGRSDRPATMTAWLELTSLTRMINDILFPSPAGTKELLRSARYVSMVKHCLEQLASWKTKHADEDASYARQELDIEFHHARVLVSSLGVQAVVDRVAGQDDDAPGPVMTATDYDFARDVVDSSCEVLKLAVRLSSSGRLRHCPVRVVLHVIAVSVFLLKALSLGARPARLDASLKLLEGCVEALRASSMDDMDLPARYSELLGLHLARFREGMAPALAPRDVDFMDMPFGGRLGEDMEEMGDGMDGGGSMEWLALPFDPSFAPFGSWGGIDEVPMEDNFLAFWDLPNV